MVEFWIVVGLVGFWLYALIAGICYPKFRQRNREASHIMATYWPIVLLVKWPSDLGVRLGERLLRRAALQRELDEARRRRDEQDAADALKEDYR
jgi:hypothetical protein